MAEKTLKTLYGGTVPITFYETSHRYKLGDAKNYLISVTGATGIIDKSRFLLPWAVNLATAYIRGKADAQAMIPYEELMAWLPEAEEQHKIKKDQAATIGSMVHDWVENFTLAKATNSPVPELPEDEKVLTAISAFLDWYNSNHIEYVSTEQLVYSKEHGYCGHFDAVAKINGVRTIIDYKTSKSIAYPEYKLQISAYWVAYEEEYGQCVDQAMILHFDKESGAVADLKITREEAKRYFDEGFIGAYNLKKLLKELDKSV